MKRIIGILFLMLVCLQVQAQSNISHSRDAERDRFENLNGNKGILLLSKYNNLRIRATNAKVSIIKDGKQNVDGFYEYIVIVGVEDTPNPHIEVHQMGSAYTTDFVASLKQTDYLNAYRIEVVPNPIQIDKEERTGAHMNALEAELEFRTTIQDLQIDCNSNLNAVVTRKNVDDQLIISVVFPIKVVKEAEKVLKDIHKKLEISANDFSEMSKEEIDQQIMYEKELDKKKTEAETYFQLLSDIRIYADSTNILSVNISDMGPREKRYYVVMPLVVIKKEYATESSAFMSEGRELYGMRKYKEARTAFQSALEAKDMEPDMRPNILESIAFCDSCIQYEKMAALAIQEISNMKKQGNATQQRVAKYANIAINRYQKIYQEYNTDEIYNRRIEKLEGLIADMPLKIKFTIVEWKTLSEGGYIPDVEIWAYYGTPSVSSSTFSSDRKFERMMKNEAFNYKQIGLSNQQGIAETELDRKNLPEGIIFRPDKESNIKINYMSLSDLIRQASGTYMEKQFRLKMYTK